MKINLVGEHGPKVPNLYMMVVFNDFVYLFKDTEGFIEDISILDGTELEYENTAMVMRKLYEEADFAFPVSALQKERWPSC